MIIVMGEAQVFEFGPFRLFPRERRLLSGKEVVSLKPIAFDILLLLVQKRAQLVSKQELMKALWPDSFVESNNLTVNMSSLRKALGDTRSRPEYIETVSGRGYRFIAPVEEISGSFKDSLRSVLAAQQTEKPETLSSLAVMPFANEGGNPDLDYLCDGMTENIIGSLSQLPMLRVMAYNTVLRYKGMKVDARGVGRQLGVAAVLTGKVIMKGEYLVVKLEMINASDGTQLWSERYNRRVSDIWIIQEQVAKQIAEKLRLKLRPQERNRLKSLTESIEAYHLYLRGCYFLNKRTEGNFRKAERDFVDALKIDPGFAHCYAGIARCYNFLFSYGAISPDEASKKVVSAAAKALELDPLLSEPHSSIGHVKLIYHWDWAGAETEFKLAIKLKPSSATAHHWYGIFLTAMGRFSEAQKEFRIALLIDPLSLIINSAIGANYFYSRNYDLAIAHLKGALELEDFYVFHGILGLAYGEKGMFDEAITSADKAVALSNSVEAQALLGYIYAKSGRTSEAEEILDRLVDLSREQYVDPSTIAFLPIGLARTQEAMTWLERAFKSGGQSLLYLAVAPWFDSLRSSKRFKSLLRAMNLEAISELVRARRSA